VTGAVQDRLAGVLTVGALVDVSGQRTILEISGPKAREVLAKGCRLDLHPRVFGAGQCAQTTYAKAPVVLVPRAGDGYWLLVRASFAEYLAEFLIDAVAEYR
jgi:sarcosine oxidase subunit gamma